VTKYATGKTSPGNTHNPKPINPGHLLQTQNPRIAYHLLCVTAGTSSRARPAVRRKLKELLELAKPEFQTMRRFVTGHTPKSIWLDAEVTLIEAAKDSNWHAVLTLIGSLSIELLGMFN
jgi:hypothetical protein